MVQQRNWLLVSLVSAVAAIATVGLALLMPTPLAVGLLALGVIVFLVVLWHNPAYRFWRMAVVVLAGWLTARTLPSVQVGIQWGNELLVQFFLTQDIGWSFDAAVCVVAIVLIAIDHLSNKGESGLNKLLAFVHLSGTRTQSARGASQQVQLGDVTGDNATINISQQQGLSEQKVVELVRAQLTDANAEIDVAAERLNESPDLAIHLLLQLRKRHWDELKPRERFRLLANLGHAHERKGDYREAARHYLEAKHHQPDDEQARSFEAAAHFLIGDNIEAYRLADAVLADHPNSALATAVRIRAAPEEIPVADLDASIPAAVRNTVEVLNALAWRLARAGDTVGAERCVEDALLLKPDSPELKEQLGAMIVQTEARRARADTDSGKRLLRARSLLSEALEKAHGKENIARLRYTRAAANDVLEQDEAAETDFRAAAEANPDDPEIARLFAIFLEKRGRRDTAIELLRTVSQDGRVPQNSLLLASLLGERNGPGDSREGVVVLEKAIPQAKDVEVGFRAALVATLARLHRNLAQPDEALSFLARLPEGYLTEPHRLAILAEIDQQAGRVLEAADAARQAAEALGADSSDEERLRVAEALTLVGLHAEALSIWKTILKAGSPTQFVRTALNCARKCEDDQFILRFCKALRENGIRDEQCLELEVATLEKYNSFDECISLLREYLASPTNGFLARTFRVRLSQIGLRIGRADLIEADPKKLPAVEEASVHLGGAVARILRTSSKPLEGVKYAYELLRRYFSSHEAHGIYVTTIGFGDELLPHFPTPDVVAPGHAVQYRVNDSEEEKWVVIDESSASDRLPDEVTPDHALAKELCGKRVGDSFYLRRDKLQNRTATVTGLISKYVYRKIDVMLRWEERFPEHEFVRRYTAPQKPDGEPDISFLLQAIDNRAEQVRELHKLYEQHPISVTSFARITHTSVFESLSHLAGEERLPVRCCFGTDEEFAAAEEAMRAAKTLVLDPSALATLFLSRQYRHLGELTAECVVCQGSLTEYRQQLDEPHRATGLIGKRDDRYFLTEHRQAAIDEYRAHLTDFLNWIKVFARIEGGIRLAEAEAEQRRKLVDLFGQGTAECIAHANSPGVALWTDDLAVAQVARSELGVRRVWTQVALHYLTDKGRFPSDAFTAVTIFLVNSGYSFTRVLPETVLKAGREASWDTERPPFAAVLRWFGNPDIQAPGLVVLSAGVLTKLWQQAPLYNQRKDVSVRLLSQLRARPDGKALLKALMQNADRFFGIDVVNAAECQRTIRQVLARD